MAHEEKRKYQACIFCGDSPNTREHFFGDSFASQMGLDALWSARFSGPRGMPVTVQGGGSILSITAPILCKVCNEQRLGPCMQSSTPILLALARGTRTDPLARAELASLLFYFERLGHLVDVATSNHDYEFDEQYTSSTDAEKVRHHRTLAPVYTPADRVDWMNSKMTDPNLLIPSAAPDAARVRPLVGEPKVYLGRHMRALGKAVEVNSNKHFGREGAPFHVGKRYMAVIGQMVFVIESGLPGGPDVLPMGVDVPSVHFKLLSELPDSLGWPPHDDVSYGDFYALYHRPVGHGPSLDHRVYGQMMDRSPEFRAEEEANLDKALKAAKRQKPKGTANRDARKKPVTDDRSSHR